MKSDKDLKILLRLKEAYYVVEKNAAVYNQFIEENPICLDVQKQLELFRIWYCSLSDLVDALYHEKQAFDNNSKKLDEVTQYFDQDIAIPDHIEKSKLTQGISLKTVLRKGRNWKSHPDKINQEEYKLLADQMDNQVLLRGFCLIHQLLHLEFESLNGEEKRKMIATSVELKSSIIAIQNMMNQCKPLLEMQEKFTPELRKSMDEFMKFIPDEDNVVLVDNHHME